jgi:hypothetical protein
MSSQTETEPVAGETLIEDERAVVIGGEECSSNDPKQPPC